MRFLIFLIIGLFMTLSGCTKEIKNKDELIIGIDPVNKPYAYIENGKRVGMNVDFYQLLAEELKMQVEFKDANFMQSLLQLKNCYIDIMLAEITEERKKEFDFSKIFYISEDDSKENLIILYNKNSPINNLSELENKKIAVVTASFEEIYLKGQIKNKENIKSYDSLIFAAGDLEIGRVNGLLVWRTIGKHFIKQNPNLDYFVIENTNQPYGLMVKKGNKELLDKVNVAIDNLEKNGKLKELGKKWSSEI